MAVRDMRPEDVPEVVRIHLQSFGGFFLSFLGPRFLTLLYEGIISHPRGVALVAETGAGIEGFVAGVTDQSDFYRELVKSRAHRFAGASFGAVVRRPAIIPRLFRALGQSRRSQRSSAKACLMSIAVRPGTSGKGLGRDLVTGFSAALVERGIFEYCLTTDRDNNDRVNQFYLKLGFKLTCDFLTPEGRAMNEYVMTLGDHGAGPA
jgi:ribosomal protein S18 acetylase RimI-like enzyme